MASIKPASVPEQSGFETEAGGDFITYHNAVIAYATQSKMTGQVSPMQLSQMSLISSVEANALSVAGAKAEIVSDVNNTVNLKNTVGFSSIVCVWMPVAAGSLNQLLSQLGGDRTIGTVIDSSHWQASGSGAAIQQIPCFIQGMTLPSAGEIISVDGLEGD